MEFQNDAEIYTGDGVKIGRLGWVVFDPRSKDVTHIIVKEGFMFDDDKVVPFNLVEAATAGRITLKAGIDPHSFPDYEDIDYVGVEIEGSEVPHNGLTPALYPYAPMSGLPMATLSVPIFLGTGRIPEARPDSDNQTLPDGAFPLKVGSKVLSSDGVHMGDLERIYTEGDSASHILVSKGVLFVTEKLIPVKWIEQIDGDAVRLSVGSKTLQKLPDQST